jgi:hypothetical protein
MYRHPILKQGGVQVDGARLMCTQEPLVIAGSAKIFSEEARCFWRKYFHEQESVTWTRLARALEAEFDVSQQILSLVKLKVECPGIGSIIIFTASELMHDIALTKPRPARCRKHWHCRF